MTTTRAWQSIGLAVALSGIVFACASTGCSLLISLDSVTEDRPADGGAGGMASSDVSNGVPDVSADVATTDATGGMSHADAPTGMADATGASDAGRSDGGACTNGMFPVPCPARGSPADGGVPADCWTSATDCSTVINCSGTYAACATGYRFDCATSHCVLACTDPMYPVMCPAVGSVADGGTAADCWTAAVDCSTVKNCSGAAHACRAGFHFDCAAAQCISSLRDSGPDVDAAPPITCTGGLTACNGRCADLRTEVANCGGCSLACEAGGRCIAGQCCTPPAAGGSCNIATCGCAAGEVCYPDTPATGLSCLMSLRCQGQRVRGGARLFRRLLPAVLQR
jgi:hypothetical protein